MQKKAYLYGDIPLDRLRGIKYPFAGDVASTLMFADLARMGAAAVILNERSDSQTQRLRTGTVPHQHQSKLTRRCAPAP